MHVRRRRAPALLIVAAIIATALPGGAFASSQTPRLPLPPDVDAEHRPSKVAYVVRDFAARVDRSRARGARPSTLSNGVLEARNDGSVELLFHSRAALPPGAGASLRHLGADVSLRLADLDGLEVPEFGLIQAWLPVDRIDVAAALPWVASITPPNYGETDPHPANGVVSEGVAFHRADDVQGRGIDGTGVTVGAISDGVSNLAASQALNELPAVNVLDTGSGDEGTAMLEIVHDMAPGAALMYDATGGGVAAHVASMNNLVANGADVITEDIAFDGEPSFQQGLAAQTGDAVAGAGVPVHSSAGNQAGRHAPRVRANGTGGGPDGAAGPYAGCGLTPDNVIAIAGGTDTTFDVTLGQANGNGSAFTLQWSEPRAIFPTAGQGGFTDLNLYVMNQALTQCLGQSIGVQANGVGDTIEQVVLPAGLAGTAAKVVVDVQGTSSAVAAPLVDLRWRRAAAVDATARAGSLNPDSNYTGLATSSAALFAGDGSGALEGFSSGGPVTLETTTQCPGGGAGPCAGVAGAATTSPGPTWSAADGVQVSGVGGFGSPFFGTSAAAPHAAACDALLRDALNSPAAAPAQTNARLAATAIDINAPGPDNNTGAGQLDCLAAVNNPPTANAGGPYATIEGTNVVLDGTGSSDPDAGDSLTYEWDLDDDGSFDDSTSPTPTFTTVGQDGVFTVRLRVTDTAGATDVDDATVTVDNVAPTVTIDTVAPADEGDEITLTGVVSDPGWLDPLTATVDWDDGTGIHPLGGVVENVRPDATLTFAAPFTYGDNGSFTIEVCGSDDDTTTCATTAAVIDNVDPTAEIDETGATLVNGIPAFLAHIGDPLTFRGRSTDPGSDDLTLSWDWDDGAPSPDVSTTYLVNPPLADVLPSPSVQPRDVTDEQAHAFSDACLFEIAFLALDDDGGTGDDDAIVIITGNVDASRSAGYWSHQYRGNGKTDFDDDQLECFLAIIGFMSAVFDEVRDASTIAAATDVLRTNGTSNARELLDRQLLAAWLNFANGAFDPASPVDTDGNGTPDTTFGAAMIAAETVHLDAGATRAQIIDQKDRIESINLMDS